MFKIDAANLNALTHYPSSLEFAPLPAISYFRNHSYFMNAPRRHTSTQRAAVLAAVQAFHGHPSAADVMRAVRKTHPRVSLGTVYRNLHLLADEGVIGAVEHARDGSLVFDKIAAPHHHFICEHCGAMIDVPSLRTAALAARVATHVRGTVSHSRHEFFGTCEKCLLRRRGTRVAQSGTRFAGITGEKKRT